MKYKARFLGTPNVFVDGEAHVFPFKKAQILALLLIEEKNISKDKICEYLWADKTIEKARRNLSNAMSYIKKILPVNVSGGGIVSVDPKIKIERDIDMLSRIEALGWTEISDLCRPFMDIAELDDWPAFSDWLLPKRQHYHDLLVKNLKKRAQVQLAGFSENRFGDAILCYEKLTECEPYDEKIHGELVRLYIKTNQKVKAVDTARSFSARIESDFGIEANLSDLSTLMKRKKETPNIRPSAPNNEDSPLARNDEILKMLDFFSRAEEGISSCGMVWGEQGIGKTVFVNEITACLAERGWECFSVDCWQEEKSYPLAPIMRLLKQLRISSAEQDNIKSLSELSYSYIAELIYRRVAETAEGMHRLLVVENIQWMDDASWNVVESIMCDNSAPRHMLVSGFEEIRSAFMLRTALADEPFEKFEITLRRFNLEETGRICHEMAPDQEWPDEKIHDVYMQTEGNPFFIKELLKYRLDGMIDGAAPYKNAYLSMIELLDEEERLFLEAIAVCPECASMKEVAKVLEISPLQVSKFYNNLRLHGFLREQESGDGDLLYYFTHTKIREALLEGMSLSRKVALHAKNIEILEAVTPPPLQYRYKKTCSRLYYHCHEAKLPLKELFWRIRELELHFMAVHEVFPTLVDQDLMHYIPTAEDVHYTQSAMAEAWEILNRIFRTEGGSPALLRMERDLYTLKGGYLWWSGRYDDADNMLRGAVRKAIAAGEPEPVIKAGVQMCYLAIQKDDAKHLSFCAGKLYKFAKDTGFRQWEGIALRFIAIANILAGRHDEVEKFLLMSTSIFEKLEEKGQNYTVCLIAAEHFRGDWNLAQGKIGDALAFYDNCINIGESVALFRGLGLSLAKAAFCLILLGRYKEAEARLQRMGKFCNIMHSDWEDGLQGGGIAFSLMGLINCCKKDWYHAGICFAVAKKLVSETKRPIWQAMLYWAKLELFKMREEMPREFAEGVLRHPQDWYEEQLKQLKHKVGWITNGG
ncbi:MAG: AAA family ATPase [bacterium]|nr:AAA family ATPase [bacterium]